MDPDRPFATYVGKSARRATRRDATRRDARATRRDGAMDGDRFEIARAVERMKNEKEDA
jgi:hypothetical protein